MIQLSIFKCVRCKNQIKKEELRYDIEGKNFICKDCLEQVIKYFNVKDSNPTENKDTKNKTRWICSECRYTFNLSNDSRISPTCPYCGNMQIIKDDFNVEKLLKESSNSLHDY